MGIKTILGTLTAIASVVASSRASVVIAVVVAPPPVRVCKCKGSSHA